MHGLSPDSFNPRWKSSYNVRPSSYTYLYLYVVQARRSATVVWQRPSVWKRGKSRQHTRHALARVFVLIRVAVNCAKACQHTQTRITSGALLTPESRIVPAEASSESGTMYV